MVVEYRVAEQAIMARGVEWDFHPSLERISALMELIGDPQKTFQVIHIAGTNGKTSTARMVESLLRERNLRVGRYTSLISPRSVNAFRWMGSLFLRIVSPMSIGISSRTLK